MGGRTHLLAGPVGTLAYITVTKDTDPVNIATFLAGCSLSSLGPDLDHPKAMLSTQNIVTEAVSGIISSFTTHRGVVHTIPAGMVFSFIMYWLMTLSAGIVSKYVWHVPDGVPLLFAIACLVGWTLHLAWDFCNVQGVYSPLWPLVKKKIHCLPITTGTFAESIFAGVVTGIICLWTFVLIENGTLGVLKIW